MNNKDLIFWILLPVIIGSNIFIFIVKKEFSPIVIILSIIIMGIIQKIIDRKRKEDQEEAPIEQSQSISINIKMITLSVLVFIFILWRIIRWLGE